MEKEIKILGDGSIVRLNDDGSIAIIGNVNKKNKTSDDSQDSNKIKYILVFLLAIAIFIIISLCVSMGEYQRKISEAVQRNTELQDRLKQSEDEIKTLNTRNSLLQNRVSELQTDLNSMKLKALPVLIGKVEIANTDYEGNIETSYGGRLLSKNSMFLQPRIECYARSSQKIKIDIKLFTPDGKLSRNNDNLFSTYSYSDNIFVTKGSYSYILGGWGGKTKGYWKSGNYKMEFWIDGILAYTKEFIIN